MNKLARVLVIFGAILIIILLIALFFGSRKIAQEIEKRLNQSMQNAKTQLEQSPHDNNYAIQNFDYTPFKCNGLMDYTCQSDSITMYAKDPTTRDNQTYNNIHLKNIVLSIRDIRNKNYLSFDIETAIDYPHIDKFFGDSKTGILVSFFNQNAEAILPNRVHCKQDFTYKDSLDLESNTLNVETVCDFESQVLTTQIKATNIFIPKIDKSHILGILYEIAMAMNEDINKKDLQAQNIPHELESLYVSLQSKQTFKDFLTQNKRLSDEQKQTLQTQLDANIVLMKSVGIRFLKSYIGQSGANIGQGISDFIQGNVKKLDIGLHLKTKNFQPFKNLYAMNIIEWLTYINKNYTIQSYSDNNETTHTHSTTKQ